MADTLKDKILALHGDLGRPIESELSANDKDAILVRCLDFVNDQLGDIRLRSITTVADQDNYDPAATTVDVLNVFPREAATVVVSNSLSSIGLGEVQFTSIVESTGLSGWENFVMYDQSVRLLNAWNKIATTFNWKFINNKIYIYPEPTSIYSLMYLSKEDFTWATVPREMNEFLFDFYAYEHLMKLAAMRIGVQGVSSEGHSLTYPTNDIMNLADKYKKNYEKKLGRLRKLRQLRT